MRRTDAIAWVVTVCAVSLRLSQAKTLAILVAATLRVQRVSLANIGRNALGTTKHQIKRCGRFVANERVEPAGALRGIVAKLVDKRRRSKPLLVALDWVDIRGFQTLVASAVLKGRSTPICWASCERHTYKGHRSRNAFEESLLLVLRSMIPMSVKVIILADRGFGRCALAAFLRRHGFSYLIRIKPKVTVKLKGFHGKLLDYPVSKGIAKVLKDVAYRADGAVSQHVVVRWPTNLPPKRDECWFLMTDLKGTAHQLCALYARRMTIEQLFRDQKSKRNGWSLRDTQIKSPDNLDRLLLIMAVAYLLLCGVGLLAQRSHKPSAWSSSSKERCSVFQIGLIMLDRTHTSASQAFRIIYDLSLEVTEKWG
ncbi:MAG: IS4 family transposase [Actinobacteria bacterium]|nr:IS4 family transposase [Actinomycetota bacterium]